MVKAFIRKWFKHIDNACYGYNQRDHIIIGDNVKIEIRNIFLKGIHNSVSIGEGSIIHGNLTCEKNESSIEIGNRVFVGNSTLSSAQNIIIGNHVLISSSCYITDNDGHSIFPEERINDVDNAMRGYKDWGSVRCKEVVIEDNVWIGYGCIILPGVHIGQGSVVGAGSVVTKNIPQRTVYGGNPARFIRFIGDKEKNP